MANNSNRRRIYGFTMRQWIMLAGVVIAVVVFGCSFCYKFVRDRVAPINENANVAQPENNNRGKKRSPGTTKPASSLSIQEATERYLRLGNPSNATQTDANNFLMVNSQYALSYNRLRGTANWVAWTVTSADFGAADRANDFRQDDRLPNGFYRVATNDYTGSGYDRGHLCPSADRTGSPEANSATFLMTNIAPQTGDLNRNAWGNLENYSRDLVRQGNELYIVAGLYGAKGKIKGKVTIPTNFWKIIVVLPNGVDDVANTTADARVIAVEMPNINGIKNEDWRKYRTTVRNIEQKTNLNLLSNLPPNVQNALESKIDNQ